MGSKFCGALIHLQLLFTPYSWKLFSTKLPLFSNRNGVENEKNALTSVRTKIRLEQRARKVKATGHSHTNGVVSSTQHFYGRNEPP